VFFTASSVLYCQQCSLLPAVFFTANALKHGFYSRRFSNRYFSNRRFSDRCLSGQEHLDLEFLVYCPIIRSSSFREFFLLKNIYQRSHSWSTTCPAPANNGLSLSLSSPRPNPLLPCRLALYSKLPDT
jgi:hypothetical protein